MKRLTQLNLFALLSKPVKSKCSSQLEEAYEEFVEMVISITQTEPNLINLYHILSYARIELENLQNYSEQDISKKKTTPLLF